MQCDLLSSDGDIVASSTTALNTNTDYNYILSGGYYDPTNGSVSWSVGDSCELYLSGANRLV